MAIKNAAILRKRLTGVDHHKEVVVMGMAVEDIENVIMNLPQRQLKKFRAWYEAFDANAWDEQIEKDATTGKLDFLAAAAIADHNDGKTF
jgi:hypothetical protein